VYGKAPAAPTTITGPTSICGLTTINYTASTPVGATGFNWTVPSGLSIQSGQGTSSITVTNISSPGGNLSVTANNTCGTGTAKTIALVVTAATPGVISGPTITCGLTT